MSQLKPAIAKLASDLFLDRVQLSFAPANVDQPVRTGMGVAIGAAWWVLDATGNNLGAQGVSQIPLNLTQAPPADTAGKVTFAPGATYNDLVNYLALAVIHPTVKALETAPVNLTAAPVNAGATTLSWQAGIPAWTTSYRVYQSVDGGHTWGAAADAGNVLTYSASGLAAGALYTYGVAAYGPQGESAKTTITAQA